MSSLNQCNFIGNLGRDPEVRATQSGQKVVTLNLAVSENWRDKQTGARREKTEWIRVVVFNENLADIAEKYLKKGSKIYISGAMQTRKWMDQSGVEKYSTEIVLQRFRGEIIMLGGKQESDGYNPSAVNQGGPAAQESMEDLNDEIPFITNAGIR